MMRSTQAVTTLKKIFPHITVVLILAVLPAMMQYLHLLDITDTGDWLRKFNGSYCINLAIVIMLFCCIFILGNSVFSALCATALFCLTFSIVDFQKMRVLHQPLLPADFAFFKQSLVIAGIYAGQAILGCMSIVGLAVVMVIFRNKFFLFKIPVVARIISGLLIGAVITAGVCNFNGLIKTTNNHFRIVNKYWDQLSNYQENGVLYAFLLNVSTSKIVKSPGYSKTAMERIFFYDSTTVELPIPKAKSRPVRPDVIIYMNESFWDLAKITSIKLSRDPVPTFHSLVKRGHGINLISPTFGGNTCMAEFEILTGMTHGFFPSGTIAYNQYIRHPVPSMVHAFRENGYSTLAIHSFKRWFWNRDNVFRYFGFDKYVGDDSMKQEPLKGTYIADEALAQCIVTHASTGKKPNFIFAMSMQNHGHYSYKRYDTLDYPVATGLSATADLEYNTYLQGIIDADKSLKLVVDYVKKAPKPTLLLFFGDHLPGFTHLYHESGYEKTMSGNIFASHMTTAVWYANFPVKKPAERMISMLYFPLTVTRMADITTPRYYRYLESLKNDCAIFTGGRRYDASGRLIAPDAATRAQDEACRLILYDALFGKKYAEAHHHVDGEDTPPPPQ